MNNTSIDYFANYSLLISLFPLLLGVALALFFARITYSVTLILIGLFIPVFAASLIGIYPFWVGICATIGLFITLLHNLGFLSGLDLETLENESDEIKQSVSLNEQDDFKFWKDVDDHLVNSGLVSTSQVVKQKFQEKAIAEVYKSTEVKSKRPELSIKTKYKFKKFDIDLRRLEIKLKRK